LYHDFLPHLKKFDILGWQSRACSRSRAKLSIRQTATS
jgi:hypothetical protein